MAKKALTTYSLVGLKMDAGEKNLGWMNIAIEIGSRFNLLPGNLSTLAQAAITDLQVTRHWWEAKIGSMLSVKVAEKITIDDYSSSADVEKLMMAQAILCSDEIELVADDLGYDDIRHNYEWGGRLFEIGQAGNKADGIKYCVIHPDENFEPVAELGVAYISRSCTRANPNYANLPRETRFSHAERRRILDERKNS